ncbi:hypothetical protein DPEC_G00281430 [Dallia pectoralis]|uniref:Uncharacterized protein n=1 Tax=Dallia pectoralis TaxID=75939 RepID=A0ACC2FN20_DALPE|nr:hypothetical protein DPEC_G00281430 [Dallia pectoralis]
MDPTWVMRLKDIVPRGPLFHTWGHRECTTSGCTSRSHALPLRDRPRPLPGGVKDICRKNSEGLSSEQREQLEQLLVEFKDSFAWDEQGVGCTHLVQHEIDTGDAQPIKTRPRRIPLAQQEAADRAVEEMEQAGFIEPSNSPWSAPVVMVPKKGGKLRFCVDYRELNAVTRKDSYPIPRVDESLDLVGESSWFSSLDLRSGYWQVPLAPEARAKTAFSTHRGHWQFTVLCFGLCNAPATFERLMDQVLSDIPSQQCLVYLDDILAHGTSFEGALAALRGVLERVTEAGLKLHPEKCHFMQREVTFLGHQVGEKGVGTLLDKVEAVRDWPVPTTKQQVKSFLGLASYYRRFVKGFSNIAFPLTGLLGKNREFKWTSECQQAFTTLKRALGEAPVIAPPVPSEPFILDTDASNVGMGAVLAQPGPEGERVVPYFSRTFSKEERRYCVTRRELLAVVAAVRHFKYYLCGIRFLVRTDHAALQWLLSFKEPEGQIARWLEELQSFNFQVEHRAVARHGNADALSRRPCAEEGCGYCEKRVARERELCQEEGVVAEVSQFGLPGLSGMHVVDINEWREKQEEDSELSMVLQWVQEGRRPSREEVGPLSPAVKGLWAGFSELRLTEGVLQRGWKAPATREVTWQVVVPNSMRMLVLEQLHGGAGAGHFGPTKTLRRLRKGFYWGQHRRDVEDYCRQCDRCAARKGPPGQSRAQLQQFPVGAPLERIGVDIVGPFPVSEGGNRWVLTAIDYFTKWPEAYALPNQEAETIVNALLGGFISRFGVPETIHSDQGRNFESRVFAEMCQRLGVEKTRTTPLHPQSDGLVERFHRTLGQQLAIVTEKHQKDWDTHLPLVLMACRSAVQDSTACSPALLMLGRELRTPAEMVFGRPPEEAPLPAGLDYARRLQDRLESAHSFARQQMERAGMRQKRHYDTRAKGCHFVAGELVWLHNPARKKGRCPKLDSAWVGPCQILERLGEVVYRIQMPLRRRRVAVHRDRLAPYRGRQTLGGEEPDSGDSQGPVEEGPQNAGAEQPATAEVVETICGQSGERARRERRRPGRFNDFVCALGVEGL